MDNRRLIAFSIFVFSIFMLWQNWQQANLPAAQPVVDGSAASPLSTPQGDVGDVPAPSAPRPASASAPAADDVPAAKDGGAAFADTPSMTVRTDKVIARISARGGTLTGLELVEHPLQKQSSEPLALFEDGSAAARHFYLAQSGLTGAGMPNHGTLFKLPAASVELAEGEDVISVRLEAEVAADSPVQLVRTLRFSRGSYLVEIEQEIKNTGAQPLSTHAYYRFLRDGKAAESHGIFGVNTFTGPAVYTDEKKFQKIDFASIDDNSAEYQKTAKDGWLAMVQHYFVAAWLVPGEIDREFFVAKNGANYEAGIMVPVGQIGAGETATSRMQLYAGPQEQDKLAAIAPELNLVVDYGWLTIIASPLFWVLSKFYSLTGNWGWAIILVTIAIKLAFFPLSAASYKSMAKMRVLAPRMQQLKERYGDDRMKLQQEMMDMYRKEKINPLGGCLPMLVQIPVFIALYWVLLGSVEMRHAPWMGWIQDLSAKDPYFILPLIMGGSMLIQMKLNPSPPDPLQAKIMMMMPIVFTFMFLWFPSGLVLYWTVNNVLSIAQQWQITRMIDTGAKQKKT